MKIIGLTIHALKIPFVTAFIHSSQTRSYSDSIVVRATSDEGICGYGEGLPRPYVTGETVENSLNCLQNYYWPAVQTMEFPKSSSLLEIQQSLTILDGISQHQKSTGVVAWNASRAAIELALVDCLLKHQHLSLASVLPPKRQEIIYSGVISSSSPETAAKLAKQCKALGILQVKVKIDGKGDRERLSAVREVMGWDVSIRVDANGAFLPDSAPQALEALSDLRIDCIEQPIPRGSASDLAHLKKMISIPLMVDESLVTVEDAQELIAENACDFFNLRISKCGGIFQTLQIAKLAQDAGIRLQLGAQVGETAILSAAGRHVAAYLDGVEYVEGSFGTILLTEDIATEKIDFGPKGKAPLLTGEGLGIQVHEGRLKKYTSQLIDCSKSAR